MDPLTPEDDKIVTLARAARARARSAQGAAVRDQDGRTYAAANVSLPSLSISALDLAVAMAVSSGAVSLEAAAVISDDVSIDAVRDLAGGGVPVFVAEDGPSGATVVEVLST